MVAMPASCSRLLAPLAAPTLCPLQVQLALQDLAACQAVYPAATYGAFASNTNLCAFSPGATADVCAGDSGGPLLQRGSSPMEDVLVGLTSYGLACSLERNYSQPGVYTGDQGGTRQHQAGRAGRRPPGSQQAATAPCSALATTCPPPGCPDCARRCGGPGALDQRRHGLPARPQQLRRWAPKSAWHLRQLLPGDGRPRHAELRSCPLHAPRPQAPAPAMRFRASTARKLPWRQAAPASSSP